MIAYACVLPVKRFAFAEEGLTYSFDVGLISLKPGDFVHIPFGKRGNIDGIVLSVDTKATNIAAEKIKPITYKYPFSLPTCCIQIAEEMSRYLFCSLSSTIRLFLPAKLRETPLKDENQMWYRFKNIIPLRGKSEKALLEYIQTEKFVSLLNIKKQKEYSAARLQSLLQKEGVTQELSSPEFSIQEPNKKALNDEQKSALEVLTNNSYSLLYGVTGSGKTEVFLQYLAHILSTIPQGQCLLLVPEISLTPQMIDMVKKVFPQQVGVVHSRIAEGEKERVWYKIHSGEMRLIIGSRSALFLPWRQLTAIIIDEEHEWTYASEHTPTYHARKVAEMWHKNCGTQIVLASATPSIESMFQVEKKQIALAELKKQVSGTMPNITVVDMKEEFLRNKNAILSSSLLIAIQETLAKKEQVLLFLNRRGFSGSLQCKQCGYIVLCPHCEIPLILHKNQKFPQGKLLCHTCSYLLETPHVCPECKSDHIESFGLGIQKLEHTIKHIFPGANIFRADKDSTSSKNAFDELYNNMKAGSIDILIGTQMTSKGFDFDKLTLVGVVNADIGMHVPDFRGSEHLFQTLMQVSGRAGRRKEGRVILQTFNPQHQVIKAVSERNFEALFRSELFQRKLLNYPPFVSLVKLTISHPSKEKLLQELKNIVSLLQAKTTDPNIKITSAPSLIPKKNGKYYGHVIVRGNNIDELLRSVSLRGVKIEKDPRNLY